MTDPYITQELVEKKFAGLGCMMMALFLAMGAFIWIIADRTSNNTARLDALEQIHQQEKADD